MRPPSTSNKDKNRISRIDYELKYEAAYCGLAQELATRISARMVAVQIKPEAFESTGIMPTVRFRIARAVTLLDTFRGWYTERRTASTRECLQVAACATSGADGELNSRVRILLGGSSTQAPSSGCAATVIVAIDGVWPFDRLELAGQYLSESAKISFKLEIVKACGCSFARKYEYALAPTIYASRAKLVANLAAAIVLESERSLELNCPSTHGERVETVSVTAQSHDFDALMRKVLLETRNWATNFIVQRLRLARRQQNWRVLLANIEHVEDASPLLTEIPNPPGRWLADPFLVQDASTTWLFAEDFDTATGRGRISVVEASRANTDTPIVCLDEPFHLSFPFVFQYQDQYWMIPETFGAREIRAYRCIAFPRRWVFSHVLIPNIRAVDTVVFPLDGKWWLLTTVEDASGSDYYSELHAFFADSPISDSWQPHLWNPVVCTPDRGRNGGLIAPTAHEGPVRISQRCFGGQYGYSSEPHLITELTVTDYSESPVEPWITPLSSRDWKTHHLSMAGPLIALDAKPQPKGRRPAALAAQHKLPTSEST